MCHWKPDQCIQLTATVYTVPKMGNAANHYNRHSNYHCLLTSVPVNTINMRANGNTYHHQAGQVHAFVADWATVVVDALAACCWGNTPLSAPLERRNRWQQPPVLAGISVPSVDPVHHHQKKIQTMCQSHESLIPFSSTITLPVTPFRWSPVTPPKIISNQTSWYIWIILQPHF